MTPLWYTSPAALAAIDSIRANPPQRVGHQRWYGATRDEWTTFAGPLVEELEALHSAEFHRLDRAGDEAALLAFIRSGSAQDVIAAALDTWLVGTHFTDDRERLAAIRANIDASNTQMMGRAA